MRKKGIYILPALAAALFLTAVMPAGIVHATGENTGEEAQQEVSEDTSEEASDSQGETEFPESYYLPIESNSIDGWPAGPQVEAEAAVVMDAGTGAFLYSKNMEAKEYPASITKIMTTLVALENGDLDSKVKFSDEAINSLDPDSSRLWMEVGEKITLRRALYGVMLASANDCANGVAEKVGGTIENFVQMMNDKAAELGCVNTHFVNAHGLHDENHYTCARDMAIITQAAMQNETFAEITRTTEYEYPKTNKSKEERPFVNHQKMLYDEEFYYKGCLGGKTGFTNDALNTLVTVAKRDGRKLICVVLRTNGSNKTFTESAQLLDYAFNNFTRVEIPVEDANVTRADILGVNYLGKARELECASLKEKAVEVVSSVKVSIPKDGDVDQVVRTLGADGTLSYSYHGWPVSSTSLKFNGVNFEIAPPKVINKVVSTGENQSESETEAQDLLGKAEGMLKSAGQHIQTAWTVAWEWVYANDVFMAVVGLVIIIALLPLVVIAYIRNRKSQKIRRQRQKEKEEMTRIEKDIENKSALEIEAELRAELERHKREQQEREKQEKERAEVETAKQEPAEAGHPETQTGEDKASEPERLEAETLHKEQTDAGSEEKEISETDTNQEETSKSSKEPDIAVQGEKTSDETIDSEEKKGGEKEE